MVSSQHWRSLNILCSRRIRARFRHSTKQRFNLLQTGARYGWNVLFMTFLQHVLRKLVSCAEMSVTRGTKITKRCCGASEHVSGAPPRHGTTGGSRCLFNGHTRRQGRISQGATAPAARRSRPPRLVLVSSLAAERRPGSSSKWRWAALCQTRLLSQYCQWVGSSRKKRLARTSRQPEPSHRLGNASA